MTAVHPYSKGNIHYDIDGEGRDVLLLHGFMEDRQMWGSLSSQLVEEGFRVIRADLPCHGESRYAEEACQVGVMADAIDSLLNELKVDNPYLIGHSLGGYVGLELLDRRPIQLTLLHSNFWADPEEKKNDRNRVISIVQRAKEIFIQEAIPHLFYSENKQNCRQDIEQLIERASKLPASEIIAATIGLRDRRPHYEAFDRHSISMIHGMEDPILPVDLLESELAKLKGKPELYIIEECGHMSIWERPDALFQLLKQILIP